MYNTYIKILLLTILGTLFSLQSTTPKAAEAMKSDAILRPNTLKPVRCPAP